MSSDPMPLLIAVLAGLTAATLVLALFGGKRGPRGNLLDRRIRQFSEFEEVDPLALSFTQRVMRPIFGALRDVTGRILPSQLLAALDAKLDRAGGPVTLNRFVAVWTSLGVVMPVLFLLLILLSREPQTIHFAALLGWTAFGNYLPWMWLRRAAQARSKRIEKDLPDAIDLIVTNVEAGLGLQAALMVVSEKFSGPLGDELARVVRDVSVGAGRVEALVAMADRTGVATMRLFTRAIGQAEQTGIPIARVLRNHSVELREKRRQAARESAAKIPVKITFPTVIVMFPTLFLLILGPVVLNIMAAFG